MFKDSRQNTDVSTFLGAIHFCIFKMRVKSIIVTRHWKELGIF